MLTDDVAFAFLQQHQEQTSAKSDGELLATRELSEAHRALGSCGAVVIVGVRVRVRLHGVVGFNVLRSTCCAADKERKIADLTSQAAGLRLKQQELQAEFEHRTTEVGGGVLLASPGSSTRVTRFLVLTAQLIQVKMQHAQAESEKATAEVRLCFALRTVVVSVDDVGGGPGCRHA